MQLSCSNSPHTAARPNLRGFALVAALLLASIANTARGDIGRIPNPGKSGSIQNQYLSDLLALVLAKTSNQAGPTELRSYPRYVSLERALFLLKTQSGLDVVWTGVNQQRLTSLQAIPIQLVKELNEFRILLIREEDQARFARIQSLADLRQFRAGACPAWPSTQVLEHNHIPLVRVKNAALFQWASIFPVSVKPSPCRLRWNLWGLYSEFPNYHYCCREFDRCSSLV